MWNKTLIIYPEIPTKLAKNLKTDKISTANEYVMLWNILNSLENSIYLWKQIGIT